jgi:hypothetical protein
MALNIGTKQKHEKSHNDCQIAPSPLAARFGRICTGTTCLGPRLKRHEQSLAKTPGYTDFMNPPLTGAEFSQDPNRCMKLLMLFKNKM